MTAPSLLLLLRYNERDDSWPPPLAAGTAARSLAPASLFTQSSAPVPLYLHFFFFFLFTAVTAEKRTFVGFHVKTADAVPTLAASAVLLQLRLEPNN